MTVDLILTSDWHLRDDTPSCRIDDFQDTQWKKVEQVLKLQNQYECPVLHAGDLFHHWKPSPWLISQAIARLPNEFYTVAGQHDLPQHNLHAIKNSGLYTLVVAGVVELFEDAGNFGQEIAEYHMKGRKVGVWHHFVWDGKNIPWPGFEGLSAREVLKQNPQFDLIVTGDNHRPFTYEYKGRLLVNCGCLTRQAADYDTHQPRVWLWNAETNTVKAHFLKVDKGAVSRKHIEEVEVRTKRIDAFISRLSEEWEVSVSFEENLKRFISSNKIRKSVLDLIYKSLDS